MDPHKNIFYYYRPPSRRSEEFIYDRQIENNTTKSLINILEKSKSPIVLGVFFTLISKKLNHSKNVFTQIKDWKLQLQTTPDAVRELLNHIVVLISNDPEIDSISSGTVGGKPDAWIYSPSQSWAFLIEIKMESKITQKQINGHLNKVGWDLSTPIAKVKWSEIYKAFKNIENKLEDASDKFLMGEFLQYLEVIGMSDFNGFTADDFDFFVNYDEEYKVALRKKMLNFSKKVFEQLPKSIKKVYSDIHPGRIINNDERWAWVVIRKNQNIKDIFKQCNFSLELNSDGFMINTVVRNGKHTDQNKPIGVLYKKLSENKSQVIQLLSQYSKDDLSFVIYRRSDRPLPGSDKWTKMADISLQVVNEELIDYIEMLLKEIKYPGIHISKRITRGAKILKDPEGLIKESAEMMVKMERILDFISA